jgi:membrane fusion protein, multidrug efflux system
MSNTKPSPGPVPTPKHPQKKRRGPGFWLVVAIAVAGGGAWLVNFVHRAIVYEATDDAYVAGHLHMISSRLDGSVTEVLVDENQAVTAGQVLARLDPLASQIEVDRNKAALHAAQAEVLRARTAVDQAKAEKAQAQAQVSVATAQVQQSDAQLELAKVNSGRDQQLFHEDTRTISESEVDTSRSAAAAAAASLTAAKAGLAAAEARVSVGAAAVESAEAQVASANAKVEAEKEAVLDAERKLSYTTISSPADGRIGDKNVEIGNRVQVGQALFALVGRDYWVTANFKETQLRKMNVGQPVEITIDAVGGRQFTGKIAGIAPATGAEFALLPPDNATGNFTKVVQRVPVKIVFDRDSIAGFEDRLSPGLSAVVSVKIK